MQAGARNEFKGRKQQEEIGLPSLFLRDICRRKKLPGGEQGKNVVRGMFRVGEGDDKRIGAAGT